MQDFWWGWGVGALTMALFLGFFVRTKIKAAVAKERGKIEQDLRAVSSNVLKK